MPNLQDQENLHFMYYADYLRVYSYNFHMKDFKERREEKVVPSKVEVRDNTGSGDQASNKKQRVEEVAINQTSREEIAVEVGVEVVPSVITQDEIADVVVGDV